MQIVTSEIERVFLEWNVFLLIYFIIGWLYLIVAFAFYEKELDGFAIVFAFFFLPLTWPIWATHAIAMCIKKLVIK